MTWRDMLSIPTSSSYHLIKPAPNNFVFNIENDSTLFFGQNDSTLRIRKEKEIVRHEK